MNKSYFLSKLYVKIMDAMKLCDKGNVIDMRLYFDGEDCCHNIYSIYEVDALYECIKNSAKKWFIDFYENINGEGVSYAEFIDVALLSDDLITKTENDFDAKWDDVNVDALDDDMFLTYKNDAFEMYENTGFSETYHSLYDDETIHNGKRFKVIKRADYTKGDCDMEQLPMWYIEFEDGTSHMAFPEEIAKVECRRLGLAQSLHTEEQKPIKTEDNMDMFETMKTKLEEMFGGEDKVMEIWNIYVESSLATCKYPKVFLNTPMRVKDFAQNYLNVSDFLISAIFSEGRYNETDRYVYVEDDTLKSTDTIYGVINLYELYVYATTSNMGFVEKDIATTPKEEWDMDSATAVTLWNAPHEEVKVEITKKYVKFYRRDDMLTCYTYKPLHILKFDDKFRKDIITTLQESCQYDENAFVNWVNSTNDIPPFPISVIFTSDYTDYTCKVYGE